MVGNLSIIKYEGTEEETERKYLKLYSKLAEAILDSTKLENKITILDYCFSQSKSFNKFGIFILKC